MKKVIFVFSSMTSAMGVKNYLKRKYMKDSFITQAPSKMSSKGCSYGLSVSEDMVQTVLNVAKENGVAVRGVFNEDGTRLKYDNQS